MSSSLNNFCESLVNGSNPRYIGSQPTIGQQVAYQVKKEEEARQAMLDSTISKMHEAQTKRDFTPISSYNPSYNPSYTPSYSTPSFSSSTPSYSTFSLSSSTSTPTYPSFNCTNYGRVI